MRSNIELLLMLAETAQAEGDELVSEQNKLYVTHGRRLLELSQMIDHARLLVEAEKARFQRWLPQEQSNAAQARIIQGDDQREYPRVSPSRQSATFPQTDSRNRPSGGQTLAAQAGTKAQG